MVDDQDRENDPTTPEQREIDIRYEIDAIKASRKRSQDVISTEEALIETFDERMEELERELEGLYQATNEDEE